MDEASYQIYGDDDEAPRPQEHRCYSRHQDDFTVQMADVFSENMECLMPVDCRSPFQADFAVLRTGVRNIARNGTGVALPDSFRSQGRGSTEEEIYSE